jgi:hypothetical protein
VLRILFEQFGSATAIATPTWKETRNLKLIRSGSYARGGSFNEPHTAKRYQSDFSLLMIVKHERLTDRVEFWASAEGRLKRELAITKKRQTPVELIVRTINEGLPIGEYIFIDVADDGIAL